MPPRASKGITLMPPAFDFQGRRAYLPITRAPGLGELARARHSHARIARRFSTDYAILRARIEPQDPRTVTLAGYTIPTPFRRKPFRRPLPAAMSWAWPDRFGQDRRLRAADAVDARARTRPGAMRAR